MKTPAVIPILFIWTIVATSPAAQTPLTIKYACNFQDASPPGALTTYEPSKEAADIITEIMRLNVLEQNFIVKSTDCKNALATTIGKKRYILYNTSFLENFKKEAQTKWAAYCVLAHEIGHHLNNHDLEETDPTVRKQFELAADRFAGAVLFKLGANLEQAQAGVNTFALEGESNTHPPKFARLEAIAVGWKRAAELSNKSGGDNADVNSDEVKLYKQAIAVAGTDKTKAIELLDKAIDINPSYSEAFTRRGEYKWDNTNKDAVGALQDLDEAVRLNKNAYEAFALRGIMLVLQNKDSAGLIDINRAIRLDKDFADAYYYRAMAIEKSGLAPYPETMLPDLNKALQLNPKFFEAYKYRGGYWHSYNQDDKAVADLTKAIELTPKLDPELFHLRADAYFSLKKYAEAIADFDKEEKLTGAEFNSQLERAKCLQGLGKTREAIAYLDKYIAKAPLESDYAMGAYFEPYLYRGVLKAFLGKDVDAEIDFQLALHLSEESFWDMERQKIGCQLVDYNLPKLALPYLEKAIEAQPDSEASKACRDAALKKLKKGK